MSCNNNPEEPQEMSEPEDGEILEEGEIENEGGWQEDEEEEAEEYSRSNGRKRRRNYNNSPTKPQGRRGKDSGRSHTTREHNYHHHQQHHQDSSGDRRSSQRLRQQRQRQQNHKTASEPVRGGRKGSSTRNSQQHNPGEYLQYLQSFNKRVKQISAERRKSSVYEVAVSEDDEKEHSASTTTRSSRSSRDNNTCRSSRSPRSGGEGRKSDIKRHLQPSGHSHNQNSEREEVPLAATVTGLATPSAVAAEAKLNSGVDDICSEDDIAEVGSPNSVIVVDNAVNELKSAPLIITLDATDSSECEYGEGDQSKKTKTTSVSPPADNIVATSSAINIATEDYSDKADHVPVDSDETDFEEFPTDALDIENNNSKIDDVVQDVSEESNKSPFINTFQSVNCDDEGSMCQDQKSEDVAAEEAAQFTVEDIDISHLSDEDVDVLELRNKLLYDLVNKTVPSSGSSSPFPVENHALAEVEVENAVVNMIEREGQDGTDEEDEDEAEALRALLLSMTNKKNKLNENVESSDAIATTAGIGNPGKGACPFNVTSSNNDRSPRTEKHSPDSRRSSGSSSYRRSSVSRRRRSSNSTISSNRSRTRSPARKRIKVPPRRRSSIASDGGSTRWLSPDYYSRRHEQQDNHHHRDSSRERGRVQQQRKRPARIGRGRNSRRNSRRAATASPPRKAQQKSLKDDRVTDFKKSISIDTCLSVADLPENDLRKQLLKNANKSKLSPNFDRIDDADLTIKRTVTNFVEGNNHCAVSTEPVGLALPPTTMTWIPQQPLIVTTNSQQNIGTGLLMQLVTSIPTTVPPLLTTSHNSLLTTVTASTVAIQQPLTSPSLTMGTPVLFRTDGPSFQDLRATAPMTLSMPISLAHSGLPFQSTPFLSIRNPQPVPAAISPRTSHIPSVFDQPVLTLAQPMPPEPNRQTSPGMRRLNENLTVVTPIGEQQKPGSSNQVAKSNANIKRKRFRKDSNARVRAYREQNPALLLPAINQNVPAASESLPLALRKVQVSSSISTPPNHLSPSASLPNISGVNHQNKLFSSSTISIYQQINNTASVANKDLLYTTPSSPTVSVLADMSLPKLISQPLSNVPKPFKTKILPPRIIIPVREGDSTSDEIEDDDSCELSIKSKEDSQLDINFQKSLIEFLKRARDASENKPSSSYSSKPATEIKGTSAAASKSVVANISCPSASASSNINKTQKVPVTRQNIQNVEEQHQMEDNVATAATNKNKPVTRESQVIGSAGIPAVVIPYAVAQVFNNKVVISSRDDNGVKKINHHAKQSSFPPPQKDVSVSSTAVPQSVVKITKKRNITAIEKQIKATSSSTATSASKQMIDELTRKVIESRDQLSLSSQEKELLQSRQNCYTGLQEIHKNLQHHVRLTNVDSKLGIEIIAAQKKLDQLKAKQIDCRNKAAVINRLIKEKSKVILPIKAKCINLERDVKKLGDSIFGDRQYKVTDLFKKDMENVVKDLSALSSKQSTSLKLERGVVFHQVISDIDPTSSVFTSGSSTLQVLSSDGQASGSFKTRVLPLGQKQISTNSNISAVPAATKTPLPSENKKNVVPKKADVAKNNATVTIEQPLPRTNKNAMRSADENTKKSFPFLTKHGLMDDREDAPSPKPKESTTVDGGYQYFTRFRNGDILKESCHEIIVTLTADVVLPILLSMGSLCTTRRIDPQIQVCPDGLEKGECLTNDCEFQHI